MNGQATTNSDKTDEKEILLITTSVYFYTHLSIKKNFI